jgi:hypothetical protein
MLLNKCIFIATVTSFICFSSIYASETTPKGAPYPTEDVHYYYTGVRYENGEDPVQVEICFEKNHTVSGYLLSAKERSRSEFHHEQIRFYGKTIFPPVPYIPVLGSYPPENKYEWNIETDSDLKELKSAYRTNTIKDCLKSVFPIMTLKAVASISSTGSCQNHFQYNLIRPDFLEKNSLTDYLDKQITETIAKETAEITTDRKDTLAWQKQILKDRQEADYPLFIYSANYQIQWYAPDAISLLQTTYASKGGNMGIQRYKGINIQKTAEGFKQIELKDYFTKDTTRNWVGILSTLVLEKINSQNPTYLGNQPVFLHYSDMQNFTYSPEGLRFYFDSNNELFRALQKPIEILVPWNDIKDILAKDTPC